MKKNIIISTLVGTLTCFCNLAYSQGTFIGGSGIGNTDQIFTHDIFIINKDGSNQDAALRLRSLDNSNLLTHWSLFNNHGDNKLFLSYSTSQQNIDTHIGSVYMTVLPDNGFIGIQKTDPTSELDVNGTTKTNRLFVGGQEIIPDGIIWTRVGENTHYNFVNGNVGIGTTTPAYKLDIAGGELNINRINTPALRIAGIESISYGGSTGNTYFTWGNGANFNYFSNGISIGSLTNPNAKLRVYGGDFVLQRTDNSTGNAVLSLSTANEGTAPTSDNTNYILTRASDKDLILNTGDANVVIGDIDSEEKLTVDGKIAARGIRIYPDGNFPDYVFDENYELKSLNEVETYIAENHKLPKMPSANEVETEGMEVGKLQVLHTEKIEELTLYIIQQQKEIEELKSLVNQLVEKKKN